MITALFTDQEVYPVLDYPYDLLWNPTLEIGYLKSDGYDYGKEYWDKYQSYVNDFGTRLTQARVNFVDKFLPRQATLCDVGIGSGQFVSMMQCRGFDVNPNAVEWLRANGLYSNTYTEPFDVLTMWDVLEHIDDPTLLLDRVSRVIISVPVHASLESCLLSKHLRPGEHIWHFTSTGIKNFMAFFGFDLVGESSFETALGREDILSYCFVRSS